MYICQYQTSRDNQFSFYWFLWRSKSTNNLHDTGKFMAPEKSIRYSVVCFRFIFPRVPLGCFIITTNYPQRADLIYNSVYKHERVIRVYTMVYTFIIILYDGDGVEEFCLVQEFNKREYTYIIYGHKYSCYMDKYILLLMSGYNVYKNI